MKNLFIVFMTAFFVTFFAELSCLIRNVALVTKEGHPFIVFAGTLLAYAVILTIGAFFGEFIRENISPIYVKVLSTVLFLVMAIMIWTHKH